MDLAAKKCIPCEGGDPPLARDMVDELLTKVDGWRLIEDGILKISKNYKFGDFAKTLDFVNKVGAISESEGHHPNICFTWGKLDITLWTHAVGGLSENDFILAAKVDKLMREHEQSIAK